MLSNATTTFLSRCIIMFNFVQLLEKWENLLDRWPGKERFGVYRFLPCFFFAGMLIEYSMIHWRPNGVNFYDTYKEKRAREEAQTRLKNWKDIEKFIK